MSHHRRQTGLNKAKLDANKQNHKSTQNIYLKHIRTLDNFEGKLLQFDAILTTSRLNATFSNFYQIKSSYQSSYNQMVLTAIQSLTSVLHSNSNQDQQSTSKISHRECRVNLAGGNLEGMHQNSLPQVPNLVIA